MRLLLLIILITSLACCACHQKRAPAAPELMYQGRPLSEYRSLLTNADAQTRQNSVRAIRAMMDYSAATTEALRLVAWDANEDPRTRIMAIDHIQLFEDFGTFPARKERAIKLCELLSYKRIKSTDPDFVEIGLPCVAWNTP